MAKTRRDSSVSFERSRKSPLHCSSSLSRESKPVSPPTTEDVKEWEDARCPVCMEHPHNAVLLICSSYHKGCRPYMCDTSYRHSNCLDQFQKSFTEAEASGEDDTQPPAESSEVITVEAVVGNSPDESKTQGFLGAEHLSSMHKIQRKLVCPLCRGQISGWVVVETARDFMNAKIRSCACETCEFNGNYTDLRKHARSDHPQVRPTEADPDRQRSWRRLERQRDIGDVLSTIQSSFGDDPDDLPVVPIDERGWITIFFLIRVWRPSSSPRGSSWSGTSRARTRSQTGARRRSARQWGEIHDAEAGSNPAEEEETSDSGSGAWRRRVRRRLSTPEDEI